MRRRPAWYVCQAQTDRKKDRGPLIILKKNGTERIGKIEKWNGSCAVEKHIKQEMETKQWAYIGGQVATWVSRDGSEE